MCLLLMLIWLPHAVSVTIEPPAPENVTLKSANFSHVLHWDRGVGTPPEVTYSVSFKTDWGPCCTAVPGCERVVDPLICNLTNAFSDPEETYHTLVTAHLDSGQSSTEKPDFHPIRDTELEPPVLLVAPCNSSVCVDMDAPLPHLHSTYDSFWYELRIQSSARQQSKLKVRSLERQVFSDFVAGSQYCVSIRFSDSIVPRESSFSQPRCVHIDSPFSAGFPLTVLLCIVVGLLLVILPFLYFTGFICLKKQALPSVLTSMDHAEELLEVFCHPSVSSPLSIKQVAPPRGQTGHCGFETDSGEDEEEDSAGQGPTNTEQYAAKASLCSSLSNGFSTTSQSAPSTQHLKGSEVRLEEPEEVNLLTLTFGRDKDEELKRAVLVPETDLPVSDGTEEVEGQEDESGEEYDTTGYMSR